MFNKLSHHLTVLAAKKLLDSNIPEDLSAAKNVLSIVAGTYILWRGAKTITKYPLLGLQETFLGGFLVYDALVTLKKAYPKRATEISQVRKNQIQGNDPNSPTPAFV